jgi:nicotinamide-nucleotide amidase
LRISARVQIEIINTGSELMLGRVLNTHQQWLCRQLSDHGYAVARQVAVADEAKPIEAALREALGRADLILTTGGLGPTSDDRTRDSVAALLGLELVENAAVLERIVHFFASRNRPMPAATRIQAMVPRDAAVLLNAHGTAPGLVMAVPAGRFRPAASLVILLPGPPRELRPMFTGQVLPILAKRFPPAGGLVCRTLRSTGLGESRVEEIIIPHLRQLTEKGLELGYCARPGEVDLRFVARDPGAAQRVAEAESIVRGLIGTHLFGVDDQEIEECIVAALKVQQKTLALAESCTGGHIANRITNVPGASAVFWGGVVSYDNHAKVTLLGVQPETLASHGAVSEETAMEMARGIRRVANSDFGISVTGIAGPDGGSAEKPVGTVFIGLADRERTRAMRFINSFDRETFKHVTSQQAFEMLRRRLHRSAGDTRP